ncbi:MAG: disulfide bond formation protein B [Proteobacteria bacterium]|nr:disulfide bond formation protein B [Pseudomonadota bacterium]
MTTPKTAPAMTLRRLARLSLGASLAALGVAYLSQYAGGLQPCPLCLLQRLPYGVIVLLGAVAVVLIGRGRRPLMLIALIGGLFALDAGIAFYHVGVEGGWFEGLAACSSGGEDIFNPLDSSELTDSEKVAIANAFIGVMNGVNNDFGSQGGLAASPLATLRAHGSTSFGATHIFTLPSVGRRAVRSQDAFPGPETSRSTPTRVRFSG